MRVVVGVDGGGSKTEAVVADRDGRCLGVGRSGGSNWERIGRPAAVDEIGRAVDAALAAAGRGRAEVEAAAFGLAGIDWPSDVAPMRAELDRLGLAGPLLVENDSAIALRAGSASGWGIVSNVGTGTITAGLDAEGHWFRTMAVGWGEPSGASSLVREALHAVAADHHGTGPPTVLTALFLERFGRSNVLGLFEALSRRHVVAGPELAPLVDRAVEDEDAVAIGLLRSSGRRHGAMVVGVAGRLAIQREPFELVCCGSRHVHASAVFADAFTASVLDGCPHAQARVFDGRAADGAVQLALELNG